MVLGDDDESWVRACLNDARAQSRTRSAKELDPCAGPNLWDKYRQGAP
jgi:hypothetical protein